MKLKRTLALVLMLTAMVFACSFAASAAETTEVYVTIANGEVVLAQEPVAVTDIDSDGALTINDALYCAHEAKFEGGAAAGYGSADSEWGLSLTKLWGVENGGSYGYYVNNASAMGLTDPVKNGDYINAFVYTDLTTWSDAYCYFDVNTLSVKAGETATLKLVAAGYDEEWNPITVPVAGASITINGVDTGVVTDENGEAVVTVKEAGVISAVSDQQILVPPVCVAAAESAGLPSYVWYAAGAAVVVIAAAVAIPVAVVKSKKNK